MNYVPNFKTIDLLLFLLFTAIMENVKDENSSLPIACIKQLDSAVYEQCFALINKADELAGGIDAVLNNSQLRSLLQWEKISAFHINEESYIRGLIVSLNELVAVLQSINSEITETRSKAETDHKIKIIQLQSRINEIRTKIKKITEHAMHTNDKSICVDSCFADKRKSKHAGSKQHDKSQKNMKQCDDKPSILEGKISGIQIKIRELKSTEVSPSISNEQKQKWREMLTVAFDAVCNPTPVEERPAIKAEDESYEFSNVDVEAKAKEVVDCILEFARSNTEKAHRYGNIHGLSLSVFNKSIKQQTKRMKKKGKVIYHIKLPLKSSLSISSDMVRLMQQNDKMGAAIATIGKYIDELCKLIRHSLKEKSVDSPINSLQRTNESFRNFYGEEIIHIYKQIKSLLPAIPPNSQSVSIKEAANEMKSYLQICENTESMNQYIAMTDLDMLHAIYRCINAIICNLERDQLMNAIHNIPSDDSQEEFNQKADNCAHENLVY